MKIAITGGYGLVGGHLAKLLSSQGHEVVCLSRRTGTDITESSALVERLRGCVAVAHCVGINRELGTQTYERVHVDGTRNLLVAAREAEVRRIALLSFLRARPACGSRYHESKWAAEELVRQSGLETTILKAGVIYGLGDQMLDHISRSLLTSRIFALLGTTRLPMRPVAVEDVASVLAAALLDTRLSGKTFALLGPEELTLQHAVARVGYAIGKRPLFFPLPITIHRGLAWVMEQTMPAPLTSLAQVQILSESLVLPLPEAESLPADLAPRTPFSVAEISRRLPPPDRFRLRDLRCVHAGRTG